MDLLKKDSFIVRQAVSLEDLRWIVRACEDVGFVLPEKMADVNFIAANTHHFFIGEIKGEKISCIAIVKLSETRYCVGFYVVLEPYRGKGFGFRMWKHAWETAAFANDATISLYSVPHMEHCYEKFGFKRVWLLDVYTVTLKRLLSCTAAVKATEGVKIIPASAADVEKVALYLSKVTGVLNRSMLYAWITFSTVSFVALDHKSSVIGCIVVSKLCPFDKHGLNVAPLIADCCEVAAVLFKSAAEELQWMDCIQPSTVMKCNVPTSCADTVQFVENSLGMRLPDERFPAVGMYTQVPQVEISKVFSTTCIEMGF